MTHTFQTSPPEARARLLQDLSKHRKQRAESKSFPESAELQAEQTQGGSNYDAQTLRFKAALEQAGYSAAEVSGMVDIFAPPLRRKSGKC